MAGFQLIMYGRFWVFTEVQDRRTAADAFSLSIDRIDSAQGYVIGNCRFILWAVNLLKFNESDAVLDQVARAIIEKRDTAR